MTKAIDRTAIESLCVGLESLYLGVVSDAVDSTGFREHFLGYDIKPVSPTMRVAGPAFTVRGAVSTLDQYEEDALMLLDMFEKVPANAVLVYETNDHQSGAAHFGELSANAVRRRGARGIIMDGAVRDSTFLTEQNFPTFCRSTSPLDGYGRWHVVEYGVPVAINGVTIRPDDFVMADRDGAIVIPAESVTAVLEEAETAKNDETEIRARVHDGGSPTELFKKYGRF